MMKRAGPAGPAPARPSSSFRAAAGALATTERIRSGSLWCSSSAVSRCDLLPGGLAPSAARGGRVGEQFFQRGIQTQRRVPGLPQRSGHAEPRRPARPEPDRPEPPARPPVHGWCRRPQLPAAPPGHRATRARAVPPALRRPGGVGARAAAGQAPPTPGAEDGRPVPPLSAAPERPPRPSVSRARVPGDSRRGRPAKSPASIGTSCRGTSRDQDYDNGQTPRGSKDVAPL